MDWNKLKFTKLDDEVMSFLLRNPTTTFMGKELADKLNVSQTAIAKSVDRLLKMGVVTKKKKVILSIQLNRDDEDIFRLKRVYNLKALYASGLLEKLLEELPGATIILFGSYALGEDTEESDVDIAIIGYKEKEVQLTKYEKKLGRTISLTYYNNLNNIDKNVKNNVLNGIVLEGGVTL